MKGNKGVTFIGNFVLYPYEVEMAKPPHPFNRIPVPALAMRHIVEFLDPPEYFLN